MHDTTFLNIVVGFPVLCDSYLPGSLKPSRLFLACVWYRFVWINPRRVCGITNIAQITEHNRKRSETVNSWAMDSQKWVMATTYLWFMQNQALLMFCSGKYLIDPAVSTSYSNNNNQTQKGCWCPWSPCFLDLSESKQQSQEILFSRNFPWVPVSPPHPPPPTQLLMFSYPITPYRLVQWGVMQQPGHLNKLTYNGCE